MKKTIFFTFMALLSLNVVFAQTIISTQTKLPEEVAVTGTVKNELGVPLVNAKVKTLFNGDYFTDNNGAFSFTLKKDAITTQSIFVSYDSLVSAVRSYHPVMANAFYNVILYKPVKCCRKFCEGIILNSTILYFKQDDVSLSDEIKKQLDEVSKQLKECPKLKLHVTAHAALRKTLQRFAELRLEAIKKYLIEQDGISIDRIKTEKTTDKINNNNVEIKPE